MNGEIKKLKEIKLMNTIWIAAIPQHNELLHVSLQAPVCGSGYVSPSADISLH